VATYYARRSARDPAWHERQLREAAERERRRRERDREAFRERHREATARCRERQREHGLTLAQLRQRCLLDSYPEAEQTLRRVLAEEVRLGRIEYRSTSRRYLLNGDLDPETAAALRALAPDGLGPDTRLDRVAAGPAPGVGRSDRRPSRLPGQGSPDARSHSKAPCPEVLSRRLTARRDAAHAHPPKG
jgi:hypothetical protein